MRVHLPKYTTRTGERKPTLMWHVYFKDHRGQWRRVWSNHRICPRENEGD